MKTNICNLNLIICEWYLNHTEEEMAVRFPLGDIQWFSIKNDPKYQVQELLGYMTVKYAQQIQQFYCGFCKIRFIFDMNKFTLEQQVSYQVHLRSCGKWLLAPLCLSVCPSVHTEELSSLCINFVKIYTQSFATMCHETRV